MTMQMQERVQTMVASSIHCSPLLGTCVSVICPEHPLKLTRLVYQVVWEIQRMF